MNESPDRAEQVVDQPDQFGAWLTPEQAQRYVGSRSANGWRDWRRRHAIVAHGRLFAKADLDRAFKAMRRRKRRMHPNSIANLKQGA